MRSIILLFLTLISLPQFATAGRMYDPEISRFMSIDPILNKKAPNELQKLAGGQVYSNSPYNYTFNNPVNLVDPDGHLPVLPLLAAAAELLPSVGAVLMTAGTAAAAYFGLDAAFGAAKEFFGGESQVNQSVTIDGTGIALPSDKTTAPGEGWVWRGKEGEAVGSEYGAWYNPETKESLKNDIDHKEPIGPHWDYTDADKNQWRVDPNTGEKTPKK